MKYIPCALLIVVMMVSITACGVIDLLNPLVRDTRKWLFAMAQHDYMTIDLLTCSSQKRQFLPIHGLFYAALPNLDKNLLVEEIRIDVSLVTIKTNQQSGDTALVRVAGKIRIVGGSAVQAQAQYDVDETWRMVKEGGNWKYCGNTRQVESIAPQPPENPDTLFTEDGLTRMVIMSSDIPPEILSPADNKVLRPVFNEENGDSEQYLQHKYFGSEFMNIPPTLKSQYRNDGFLFFYYSEFDDNGRCGVSLLCTVRSEAILWKDSADASWGMWFIHDNMPIWKKIDNLADECYLYEDPIINEYLCRVKNVSIDIQFMSPRDVGLFDKIYARVNSR